MSSTFSLLDHLIIHFDEGLKTLWGAPIGTLRGNPAAHLDESELSKEETRLSSGLMRVNHTGEVCAQALYLGQAFGTSNLELKKTFKQAALEENDHLRWCKARLDALGTHPSFFNPFWYGGAFLMGAFASRCGDHWSLGFLEETERQVVKHLEDHLNHLPSHDHVSHAIVGQMIQDETKHATTAAHLGAASLPKPVRILMKLKAKVMTTLAYYI